MGIASGGRENVRRWRIVAIACFALVLPAVARPPAAQAQREAEIAILRELVAEVEGGRRIILAPHGASNDWGTLVMVDSERAGAIAVWQVARGMLHPDSVTSWTRKQLAISRTALEVMKQQLRELEGAPPAAGTPATPPGATPDARPAPIDWRLAKETLRGTYDIPCPGYWPGDGGDFAPGDDGMRPLTGNFTLTLVGDGAVRITFDFHRDPVETRGTIRNDAEIGVAEGGGPTPDYGGTIDVAFDESVVQGGDYKWMLRLGRWNDRVVLEPYSTLEFLNRRPVDESPPACQPGTMRFAD